MAAVGQMEMGSQWAEGVSMIRLYGGDDFVSVFESITEENEELVETARL